MKPHYLMPVFRSLVLMVLSLVIIPGVTTADLAGSTDAASAETQFSPEQIRNDFTQLYQTLQHSHFDLYINTPKASFDQRYQEQLAALDQPMGLNAVTQTFQRFVALSHIAHARVEDQSAPFSAHLNQGGRLIPLNIRVVAERVYLQDLLVPNSDLQLGDELLSLNGQPINKLLDQLRLDLSADNTYLANTLLEFEFPRLLWQALGEQAQFQLQLRRGQGEAFNVTLAAVSRAELQQANQDTAEQNKASNTLNLSWSAREARVLVHRVAYLRPGPFYQADAAETGGNLWDTQAFAAFIDTNFQQFIDADVSDLLIDLRNNPGGDNSFSDLMVSWFASEPYRFCSDFRIRSSAAARESNQARLDLAPESAASQAFARAYQEHAPGQVFSFPMPLTEPRADTRFKGRVYALINRHSYSNAVTVAAILQDYNFATVLGEPTADLATTLGAMEHFTLAETGLKIGFPKAEIIRPSGSLDRQGVVPDVMITTPIVESADDPVLQQALAHIRQQQSQQSHP